MITLSKVCFIAVCATQFLLPKSQASDLVAELGWRYAAPSESCEIAAHCSETHKLFVTTGVGIDVVDVSTGQQTGSIEHPAGYHPTSVTCSGGMLAVAWAADDKHEKGIITIYDSNQLVELATSSAGFLPDMVTFTPDGKSLLVANEGEPNDDYSFDPEGSVTIITPGDDWQDASAREVRFTKFDSQKKQLIADGVRVFGPNQGNDDGIASVAQDLEPEYIAVSADSKKAWITLQENNAIAELDIEHAEITTIYPLGLKDFRVRGNNSVTRLVSASAGTGLDVSDQDGGVRIRHWPVAGLFQPDGIATFEHKDESYLVTANEGDPRYYANFCEPILIGSIADNGILVDRNNPARHLTNHPDLARLEISRSAGDLDGDGDLDEFVCFGTRSFSIWRRTPDELELVFDSGNGFEQTVAREAPHLFNVDSYLPSVPDNRSTTRGPEPENVTLISLDRRHIAAISLERTGGVMFYDVSNPRSPSFLGYLQPNAEPELRDRAPEGLLFIPASQNPLHKPLLVVCNEGSGTMTAHTLSLNVAE
ncbi:choice-of-anchor I family protein [Bythopirellula goksoeyrii]|uniref:Choice-of-anchor I domain-containing protein n=1 Tax=Bythopirellula goksoeyrii TaxID=1400387 RepID=A0A5B9Q558_9BACT|nr:choice-of-anchor I family protein [Bythopirellula goksoeyrii]QEG32870.1 hypothetical protein Pr1d_01310 [Bythopirellula goksoeyrii]